MKPETARKHFIDPFRYWHPVTNNNVQKSTVKYWSHPTNRTSVIILLFVAFFYFYFYFSIAYTLSGLTLPQINFINEFLVRISYFLFPVSYFLFPVSCFLFPISCFLFPISYFLFPVEISYFEFLVRISKIVW